MQRRCLRFSSIARAGAVVGGCALLLVVGCKHSKPLPKIVPVQGKVTLDGQPLTGGGVLFHSFEKSGDVLVPRGAKLEDDGSYSIKLPLGKYRAQVDPGTKSDRQQWARIPQKYTGDRSPLIIEVTEDKPEGSYDIKLQSAGSQPKGQQRR
jgi:hypothetical protein